MQSLMGLDRGVGRRSPVTMAGYRRGCPPANKGLRYPADPPSVEEIIAVMRQGGPGPHGVRLRCLVALLWRSGLRIGEALALSETDLDRDRGSVLVRRGKGGRRPERRTRNEPPPPTRQWRQLASALTTCIEGSDGGAGD